MKDLQIHIEVNSELYLKKPDSSELGRRIISGSIELINELGFEIFTFKKLGNKIGSPESSIYRYFESKHTLLIYLTSWFWSWIEYRLVFATINIDSPTDKLKRTIKILTQPVVVDKSFSYIDEVLLHKIIITESVKVFHTKDVDDENEKGYFKSYKQVVQRVGDMVLEINPKFKFPHMLISTVIEGANHQRYFAQHLPALTNVEKGKENIVEFYTDLIFKVVK
ncbi:TetR/AcrR family transcriptional regulator [Lutibacter sp.]|uniref:TetR/AcrR family transcriptional regulator n=1 Tax=Lutibacter sp. TaxID=1925666 RepID=UPI0025C291FC|nr:TetR/AcrR family transcriptional regulator [Lutibacter sp.]MCF6169251.1 TetR/AcrR family transcriptional regulator [Lutibacter sp.]